MSDRVLVPVAGLGVLALDPEVYRAALAEGAQFAAPAAPAALADEPLLTPEQLAAQLSVPETRIAQLAREGRIPSVRVGRYVRFRRSAVERVLAGDKSAAA